MSEAIDGGPAFPRSSQGAAGDIDIAEGMTLRDAFAIASLQAFGPTYDELGYGSDKIAICSYALADAMLEARKKPKP